MRIPTIRGVIDRRILVNFHVDAEVLARVVPRPFRPKLVAGYGIAGICLIRLKHIRPLLVPAALGLSSENAAHRIAVEWEQDGQLHEGVYIPRRDTSSWLNSLAGGRLFTGVHHHARFQVEEREGRFSIHMHSDDRAAHLVFEGRLDPHWPATSVFRSLQQASAFFQRGSLGYSATGRPGVFDGLELRTLQWRTQPLAVERVESGFFENRQHFPEGSVYFDCALLMQGIEHEWHGRPVLHCPERLVAPVPTSG